MSLTGIVLVIVAQVYRLCLEGINTILVMCLVAVAVVVTAAPALVIAAVAVVLVALVIAKGDLSKWEQISVIYGLGY